MKRPYKYTVDETVLKVFTSSARRQRGELLRIFDFLARHPFTEGDSIQLDTSRRPCQVKRFGPWTITYWPEHHLSNHIHIIDVERLG